MRSDAIARFYLRPNLDRRLAYTLVVREATQGERSDPHRDYLTVEIYEPRKRKPAMVIPVGSGMGGWGAGGEIRNAVRAALSFASEPSGWDDPAERAASEDVGVGAYDAAMSHRVIGRWLDLG